MSDVDPFFEEDIQVDGRKVPAELFQITDEVRANWLLRKLGNCDAERKRVQAQAKKRLEQIEADETRLMNWLGDSLRCWVLYELEQRGEKRKSLTLLQGTCAFRTVPTSFSVEDTEAAVKWAEVNRPDLLKIEYILDKDGYKAVMKETGEVLPGVHVKQAEEKFSIRFEGGK